MWAALPWTRPRSGRLDRMRIELVGDKRVFITGAAGFAGSRLTRALLSLGYEVTGLDLTAPNHAGLLQGELSHPGFRYLWKSVQDIQPSDVGGHSVVAHLAAQPDTPMAFESPRYTVMQNVGATVELLEAVRLAGGVSKVLFAASGNELGRPLYLPMDEEHPLTPHNPYGFSKAAAELAMWAWHRAYGIPTVVLFTGVVVGPSMRREVFIFKWLWNAMHSSPIVVEGGRQTRDLTYIDDVVQAWTLAVEAPADQVVGQKFYVEYGTGRDVPGRSWFGRAHRPRRLPPRRGGSEGGVHHREGPAGVELHTSVSSQAGYLPNRRVDTEMSDGILSRKHGAWS